MLAHSSGVGTHLRRSRCLWAPQEEAALGTGQCSHSLHSAPGAVRIRGARTQFLQRSEPQLTGCAPGRGPDASARLPRAPSPPDLLGDPWHLRAGQCASRHAGHGPPCPTHSPGPLQSTEYGRSRSLPQPTGLEASARHRAGGTERVVSCAVRGRLHKLGPRPALAGASTAKPLESCLETLAEGTAQTSDAGAWLGAELEPHANPTQHQRHPAWPSTGLVSTVTLLCHSDVCSSLWCGVHTHCRCGANAPPH